MINNLALRLMLVGLMVSPVFAQPREWFDDFLTNATYDSASLLAPCYGGPHTKYTVFEGVVGDIFNERVVSGGGRLIFSNRVLPGITAPDGSSIRQELISVGEFGVGTGCPGAPPVGQISEPFTSSNLCIYGGYQFNAWHILQSSGGGSPGGCVQDCPNYGLFGVNGADAQPGAAGVDDDGDGTIDEPDESPNRWPIAGSAYGPPFPGGPDGRPGLAGVDDDGNGITDDIGETSWPATDDGDDGPGRVIMSVLMKSDALTSSGMFVNIDQTSTFGDLFGLRDLQGLVQVLVEGHNEISPGFYQANTCYNYVYCTSGICYGAVMWIETDLANPKETLGPLINTNHTNPNDSSVGFLSAALTKTFLREVMFKGSRNFSNAFWVISGNPTTFFPSVTADLDDDRDVDANDFLTFSNCFNGSLNPPKGFCSNLLADLDGDGDVDANDFLTFSNCFNGALNRPNTQCMPPNLTACGP